MKLSANTKLFRRSFTAVFLFLGFLFLCSLLAHSDETLLNGQFSHKPSAAIFGPPGFQVTDDARANTSATFQKAMFISHELYRIMQEELTNLDNFEKGRISGALV